MKKISLKYYTPLGFLTFSELDVLKPPYHLILQMYISVSYAPGFPIYIFIYIYIFIKGNSCPDSHNFRDLVITEFVNAKVPKVSVK